VTACRDCNRSKNKKLVAPALRLEELKEKSKQLQAFIEYTQQIEQSYRKMVQAVIDEWHQKLGYTPSASFTNSLYYFVRHLPLSEIFEAIDCVLVRDPPSEYQAQRYFYGVLWNKVRSRTGGDTYGRQSPEKPTGKDA